LKNRLTIYQNLRHPIRNRNRDSLERSELRRKTIHRQGLTPKLNADIIDHDIGTIIGRTDTVIGAADNTNRLAVHDDGGL